MKSERGEREREKMGKRESIKAVVLLLNEIVESIFLMRIFQLQLSKSSLLNILLIKFCVLSFFQIKLRWIITENATSIFV